MLLLLSAKTMSFRFRVSPAEPGISTNQFIREIPDSIKNVEHRARNDKFEFRSD
jgi:hypothetical protein